MFCSLDTLFVSGVWLSERKSPRTQKTCPGYIARVWIIILIFACRSNGIIKLIRNKKSEGDCIWISCLSLYYLARLYSQLLRILTQNQLPLSRPLQQQLRKRPLKSLNTNDTRIIKNHIIRRKHIAALVVALNTALPVKQYTATARVTTQQE